MSRLYGALTSFQLRKLNSEMERFRLGREESGIYAFSPGLSSKEGFQECGIREQRDPMKCAVKNDAPTRTTCLQANDPATLCIHGERESNRFPNAIRGAQRVRDGSHHVSLVGHAENEADPTRVQQ